MYSDWETGRQMVDICRDLDFVCDKQIENRESVRDIQTDRQTAEKIVYLREIHIQTTEKVSVSVTVTDKWSVNT